MSYIMKREDIPHLALNGFNPPPPPLGLPSENEMCIKNAKKNVEVTVHEFAGLWVLFTSEKLKFPWVNTQRQIFYLSSLACPPGGFDCSFKKKKNV